MINSNVKKFIKKDAKMSIGSDGLMGDKLVVVAPVPVEPMTAKLAMAIR